jgi:hypothetical protein
MWLVTVRFREAERTHDYLNSLVPAGSVLLSDAKASIPAERSQASDPSTGELLGFIAATNDPAE